MTRQSSDTQKEDEVVATMVRSIQFFRASEAPDLMATGIMEFKGAPPEREPLNPLFAQAAKEGSESQVLFRAPNGFSLVRAWFKSNFPLPAHSHNSDCLYYVVAGELQCGPHNLKPGDGFYVPSDVAYSYVAGPQGVEVLEFRGVGEFDIKLRSRPFWVWERAAATVQANLANWPAELPPSSLRT